MAQWTNTQKIIAGIVAALVLIAAAFGWAAMSTEPYKKEVAGFKQQLAAAHAAQQSDFEQLPPSATNADAARLMEQSEKRLQNALTSAPEPPFILMLPFVADGVKHEFNDLRASAQALETALRNIRVYIAYEGEVQKVVRDVSSKEHVTLAGQQASVTAWKTGTEKLQTLTVPAGAEATHATFVAQFKEIENILTDMLAATNQGDFNAYMAQEDTFSASITELQKTSQDFKKFARTYDDAVTAAYDQLGKLL